MEARSQIRDTLADFTVLWWDCQKQPLSLKKLFSKSSRYPQEITVLEPLFKNVTGLKACNFIEKSLQHRCFHENIAKFLVLLFSKNICKRLLFDFFNGSLLHGPKGSRSRLYDGVRLQGLRHRCSFLFLSWHELSPSLQPAFENLRQIPLMSQLSFYIGYFWSF